MPSNTLLSIPYSKYPSSYIVESTCNTSKAPVQSPIPLNACEVSTRTITCTQSSIRFNITHIFNTIEPVNINGDKREVYESYLHEGSIVFTKFGYETKGTHPDKSYKEPTNILRNSLTIILNVADSRGRYKFINMKVPPSGMIQFTGCLEYYQAIRALTLVVKRLLHECPSSIELSNPSDRQCRFMMKTHMSNIKVHLKGRNVDRDKLRNVINLESPLGWRAVFDHSGYSGVNIKCFYTTPFEEVDIPIPVITLDLSPNIELSPPLALVRDMEPNSNGVRIDVLNYQDYIGHLSPAELEREQHWYSMKRLSIMMFQTGTITLSGVHERLIRPIWKLFIDFVLEKQDGVFFGEHVKIVDY